MERVAARPRWGYYAALVLFVAILAFAVLGLVRSSSRAGAAGRPSSTTPSPSAIPLAKGPIATPQIPPPPPSAPTQPPSRTILYPPPEVAATAPSEPGDQPR
jgi:hypothetical protein